MQNFSSITLHHSACHATKVLMVQEKDIPLVNTFRWLGNIANYRDAFLIQIINAENHDPH